MTRFHSWWRPATLAIVLSGALLGGACAASKTISHVLMDPSQYRDHDVTVGGTVQESFSVADRGIYMIDDGTGQLWVVSTRGTPRRGARVTAKGEVRDGFNFGSFGDLINLPGVGSGLVLVESSRKVDDQVR